MRATRPISAAGGKVDWGSRKPKWAPLDSVVLTSIVAGSGCFIIRTCISVFTHAAVPRAKRTRISIWDQMAGSGSSAAAFETYWKRLTPSIWSGSEGGCGAGCAMVDEAYGGGSLSADTQMAFSH